MKIKRLCVLAVLLTSSLAGADDNAAANLESQYYAGLNFGAGWGDGFKMKPGVVLGYHYDQNSEFELEVLSNVKSLKSIGASLLVNYRFYPGLNIDPVKLYVSGGLGGYVQIIEAKSGSNTAQALQNIVGKDTSLGGAVEKADALASRLVEKVGVVKNVAERVDEAVGEIIGTAPEPSLVDKMLGAISYKLKVGVDYEVTPQIIGTVGMTMGGQLSSFKPPLQIPDAMLEVGIRYNF
ncbi:hypothetical protein [Wolbachia endosymbiont of Cylisticus convexus]|uniref:hypothetical protein n=1 Tax=Wolbachia endosymbiont of Cylisticus convexus TaxID=118728 RepID=UPI000DF705FB|nr:hypothetical protein [Wolbachia endosymbiont of Cylisticus convexus]